MRPEQNRASQGQSSLVLRLRFLRALVVLRFRDAGQDPLLGSEQRLVLCPGHVAFLHKHFADPKAAAEGAGRFTRSPSALSPPSNVK